MSTRGIAVELINSLPEEQVKGLVDFIKGFVDNSTKKKLENMEREAEQKDLVERQKAFERLDRLVRENSHYVAGIGDNDKEILAAHRREKYGL